MKQIVDPFMPVSRPANNMSAHVDARRTKVRATAAPPAMTSPQANVTAGRSTRNIDGVVPSKPPQTGYRGPAGSLHLQYVKAARPTVNADTSLRTTNNRPMATTAAQSQAQPQPRPQQSQPQSAKTSAAKPKQANPAKKDTISTVWLVVGAAVAGLAMFSVLAGQIAIAVYAIAALWRRWPSQQSFMLALVMFGGIIVALVIPNFKSVADNLAVYAFLLLAVGTISLAREARRDMRQIASD